MIHKVSLGKGDSQGIFQRRVNHKISLGKGDSKGISREG